MTIQDEYLLTLYSLTQNWICLAARSISTPVWGRGSFHWGETLLTIPILDPRLTFSC